MRRTWWLGLGLFVATGVSAQAADPPKVDSCPGDLAVTAQYAGSIKATRDNLEQEVARLKAHVTALQGRLADLEKKPK